MLDPQVFLKLLMALLELSQITKMELFVKNLNNIKSLTASHLKLLWCMWHSYYFIGTYTLFYHVKNILKIEFIEVSVHFFSRQKILKFSESFILWSPPKLCPGPAEEAHSTFMRFIFSKKKKKKKYWYSSFLIF